MDYHWSGGRNCVASGDYKANKGENAGTERVLEEHGIDWRKVVKFAIKKTDQPSGYRHAFNEFLKSSDRLRVYEGGELIFSSIRKRLLPLMDYIDGYHRYHQKVIIFDKIMGNAAALLAIKARCRGVYSPLGSQPALETLGKYGINHHIGIVVPYIQQGSREDICPMEKLSLHKDPEEFYAAITNIINTRDSKM